MNNNLESTDEIIAHNIKYIREKSKLTQNEFGEIFSLAKGVISSYENCRHYPQLNTIKLLTQRLIISIDEFVSVPYNEQNYHGIYLSKDNHSDTHNMVDGQERRKYQKYIGTYNIYSYKTDKDSNELNIGKLELSESDSPIRLRVSLNVNNSDYQYNGTFTLLGNHAYIHFYGRVHYEKALIILYNADSIKGYIGGIGMALSLSHGHKRPCAQNVMVSKADIPLFMYDRVKEFLKFENLSDTTVKVDSSLDKKAYEFIKGLNLIK
jgi:transcriptional regulator with XRE-family HTH domain